MRTTIEDITNYLEEIAPLNFQESYDNAGLLIGSKNQLVSGVLITLDSTEEIIDEALANNCNLIIAHHPIIFSGLKKLTNDNYIQRVVTKAIKNDISIYASHTNLDSVANGVNKKIAEKIELTELSFLFQKSTDNNIGSGMIGKLNTPLPTVDFLNHIKTSMNLNCIRHTNVGDKMIQTVAVCGGSGSFLLKEAMKKKCRCICDC